MEPLRHDDLCVRLMREEDARAVHRCRHLPEVARYQGWFPELAEVVALAREQGARAPGMQREPCQLVIEVRQPDGSTHLAGDVGAGAFDPGRQMELGIVLDPAWQGRGLATRALRLVLDRVFASGLHRVTARVDPRNGPSLALFDRLGFRREGLERRCYWDARAEEWTDEVCFALLAEEWRR